MQTPARDRARRLGIPQRLEADGIPADVDAIAQRFEAVNLSTEQAIQNGSAVKLWNVSVDRRFAHAKVQVPEDATAGSKIEADQPWSKRERDQSFILGSSGLNCSTWTRADGYGSPRPGDNT